MKILFILKRLPLLWSLMHSFTWSQLIFNFWKRDHMICKIYFPTVEWRTQNTWCYFGPQNFFLLFSSSSSNGWKKKDTGKKYLTVIYLHFISDRERTCPILNILFLFITIGSSFSSDGFIIDSTLVDIGQSEAAPIFSLLSRCIVS